ncbi:S8 family peptidase [Flavihumibacter fluvii]|uniref:S8 family peptidase n=1 Tax=Flavihumibacter fluvii TaxID=2838157 RepID=UPI001BDE8373|nr:S8 family peptidase [Flavihumibacter fluvii]ULQ52736.1 S8 family peptidase [Flavihumibacter fluvii]
MRPFLLFFCWLLFAQRLWSQLPGENNRALAPFFLHKADQNNSLDTVSRYIAGHFAYATSSQKQITGDRVLRKINDHTYIIAVHTSDEWTALDNKSLNLVPVNNYWKLSPDLLAENNLQKTATGYRQLVISVLDSWEFISAQGKIIKIIEQDLPSKTFRVEVPYRWINDQGLPDKNILFIALSRKAHTERELTGFDLSANQVNTAHRYWPGINGNGLTISIKENRMDTADIDFSGRYVFSPGASPIMQTHATTMATIAAGGGNSFYTGKGVAWGSRISSSDFANLLPDDARTLAALNVSVQNHSYGTGIENYYGADARAYDLQVSNQPFLVHVFSAGNSGLQTSSNGNYSGVTQMANITGSFKMAKNTLVVAAMDSIGDIPVLISRGPAFDGRVKPELVAFGEDGSSGAAAIASGLAVLIQDAYKQQHGQLPTASMVKAIMINSATDIGAAGIDFYSGYGAVNAFNSIETIQRLQYASGSISNGETKNFQLSIPNNARNLKVTISWTDPAALANSGIALVNDLDLRVIEESSGSTLLPWVLNSSPNIDSLLLLPLRKRDSLNNTEQVSLLQPSAGNYTISVVCNSFLANPQEFALAWDYDTTNLFQFNYPVKGDNILPAKNNTIRWSTTMQGQGTLEYRLDGKPDWQVAVSQVNLSAGYLKWSAPHQFTIIQFRMKASGLESLSDTVSVSDNLFIRTGFDCVDSFLIYWQKAPEFDHYRLYRLQDKYLEPYLDLQDTAVVQYKANNPGEWFTVAPVLANGIEGVKAYTFNYTQQETGCYIRNFLADPAATNQARLTLELGTVYGVKRIQFEKQNNSAFVPVGELRPVNSTVNIFTTPAQDGLNIYRALVELEDGTNYYTTSESVYQFGNQSYFVFPNPAQGGTSIRIMAEEPVGSQFILYDFLGRKILVTELTSTIQTIDISQLSRGIYFYIILKDGVKTVSKKLLIQ